MWWKGVWSIFGVCGIAYFSHGASASQQTPEDRLWVEAIKADSVAKIRPLVHPACPQKSISPEILARMVEGGLPEIYEIETRELGRS
jgi:hypothetical protein